MKKQIIISLNVLIIFCSMIGCKNKEKQGPYFIGIVTGTVSSSEDELRAAEFFMDRYGKYEEGGIVKHSTYPDNYSQEIETTISTIKSFADDPQCKAIIVVPAVPGTAAAFAEIKKTRPEILLFSAFSHEDWRVSTQSVDLQLGMNNVARGYLMMQVAKKLGAKNFVQISPPYSLGIESISRRMAVMKQVGEELGITFSLEISPDPRLDGVPSAQQFIIEQMPIWVERYGKETVFYTTLECQTEPLLRQVADLGAFFIEADLPGPLNGYPGAFGVELKDVAGNWPAILQRVEEAVVAYGGGGRMGTWAYSVNYTAVVALAELAKRTIDGEADYKNQEDLIACFSEYSAADTWKAAFFIYVDGTVIQNYRVVYQDTYIFGLGSQKTIDEEVPQKYYTIK